MNNSRKDTLIISNRLAEEIRRRTNLSRQGEGKASQVLCLAFPHWPASPACLLQHECCCHIAVDQRNHSAARRGQAMPKLQQGSWKWVPMGNYRFSLGPKWWDSSCNSSATLARSPPEQFGTSLLQPGRQWGAWSPAVPVSHVHIKTVSVPGLPTHQSTQRVKEKLCLVVSHLLRAKIGWFRGTAGDGEDRRERAATLFKDTATFIANQTNCPTVVTPCLRQWLASRIDVKHLKWEITN